MSIKLKLIPKEERTYVEWAPPEAKTVVATEEGMLRHFEEEDDE